MPNSVYLTAAIALIAAWCVPTSYAYSETLHIKHPYNIASDEIYAEKTRYLVELLDLTMRKSGLDYSLEKVQLDTVTANRNTRNLLSGLYDVNWMHTNKYREQILLPIRIPLFRGLTGWRLMMLRKGGQQAFDSVKSLADIKQLVAGQGHDWPDTAILKYHNFRLITSTSRNSLTHMLEGKRVDYFPRAVMEIWDELEVYKDEPIEIESRFAIVYPTANYFFVKHNNFTLGAALSKGLNKSIADGSFNALFMSHYGEDIARSNLQSRTIFYLDNPNLSPETPLSRQELWYSIDAEKNSPILKTTNTVTP